MATIQKSLQREALQLVFRQLMVIMALTLLILLIKGLHQGLAFFTGGNAYILPNYLFAWWVFSAKSRFRESFMIYFMLGEFFKLFCSAVFFILIAKYLSLNLLLVISGYIAAILSFWFICAWHFGRRKPSSLSTRASL